MKKIAGNIGEILRNKINLLMYRITGRIFSKKNSYGNSNWKTIENVDSRAKRKIFGYKLEYPDFEYIPFRRKWWATPIFSQKQNTSTRTRPLLIVGQGWTGSSAICDYIREFRGVLQYGSEFRMIKDPGGIIELESAVIDHWTYWNASVAIKRFMRLAELHARRKISGCMREYLPVGLDNDEICNGNFIKFTKEYIDDLSFLRFPGNWFMDDCGKTTIGTLWANAKRRLGRSKEEFFMIHPERDKFIKATRKYINSISKEFDIWAGSHFNITNSVSNIDWIIFDQAVWPQACLKALDYFENAKIIVVERDPRDVYLSVSGLKSDTPVGKHRSYCPSDPELFAKYYRKLMENSKLEKNSAVLRMKFEDFNLKHGETSALVRDFLGIDLQDQLIPRTFYKREISSSRVGKWRNCSGETKEAMEIISEMLPEYCYSLKG